MVLRGLDDVSEIVMRAGAGEWACQPQPAPDLAPASWHQRRPGVGDLGSDGCRRPAVLQTRATNCSSNCRAGRLWSAAVRLPAVAAGGGARRLGAGLTRRGHQDVRGSETGGLRDINGVTTHGP